MYTSELGGRHFVNSLGTPSRDIQLVLFGSFVCRNGLFAQIPASLRTLIGLSLSILEDGIFQTRRTAGRAVQADGYRNHYAAVRLSV